MSIKTVISNLFSSKSTSQPVPEINKTEPITLAAQPIITNTLTLQKESINMSIIKDIESFASKFEAEFTKLWGKAPTLSTIALTTIKFAAPLIESVVGIEAGAGASTEVTEILDDVEHSLVAAAGLVTAVGPTVSVTNLITGISNDLTALLAAGHVTNSTSVSNITLVVKELAALLGSLPAPAPVSTVPVVATVATV